MKEKIDKLVRKALATCLNPKEAIIAVMGDDASPEMIDRLCEAYNVKKFANRQQEGYDMEEEFPIADASQIKAIAKIAALKSIRLPAQQETQMRDFYKEASLGMSVPVVAKENPAVERGKSIARHLARKTAAYIKTFETKYAYDEKFIQELRYLYPNSQILKAMGICDGKRRMTARNRFHEEFGDMEKIIAALKKKKLAAPKRSKFYTDKIAPIRAKARAQEEKALYNSIKDRSYKSVAQHAAIADAKKFVGKQLAVLQGRDEIVDARRELLDYADDATARAADKVNKKKHEVADRVLQRGIEKRRRVEKHKQLQHEKGMQSNQNNLAALKREEEKRVLQDTLDVQPIVDNLASEARHEKGRVLKHKVTLTPLQKELNNVKREEEAKDLKYQVGRSGGRKVERALSEINDAVGIAQAKATIKDKKKELRKFKYPKTTKALNLLKGINPENLQAMVSIPNSFVGGVIKGYEGLRNKAPRGLLDMFNPLEQLRDSAAMSIASNTLGRNKILHNIAAVSSLQEAFKDRRLEGADPKFLMDAFKEYTSVAPLLMTVPGVATNLLVNANAYGSHDLDAKSILDLRKAESGLVRSYEKSKGPG